MHMCIVYISNVFCWGCQLCDRNLVVNQLYNLDTTFTIGIQMFIGNYLCILFNTPYHSFKYPALKPLVLMRFDFACMTLYQTKLFKISGKLLAHLHFPKWIKDKGGFKVQGHKYWKSFLLLICPDFRLVHMS